MKTGISSLILIVFGIGFNAYGYQVPSALKNVRVQSSASFEAASGLYLYKYRVTNPSTNDGKIRAVRISISRIPRTDADLPSTGLSHCPHHSPRTARVNLERTPMVPVGSSTPSGWSCDYMPDGSFSFGALDESDLIDPGMSQGDFVLKSRGIPGIRDVTVIFAIDYQALPPEWEADSVRLQALQESVKWVTKTVGPAAPPADFKPVEFVDTIESLAEQARQLGWTTDKLRLKGQLEKAKDAIRRNRTQEAVQELRAIGHEIEHRRSQMTSEAYALLKFNADYLVDRLSR